MGSISRIKSSLETSICTQAMLDDDDCDDDTEIELQYEFKSKSMILEVNVDKEEDEETEHKEVEIMPENITPIGLRNVSVFKRNIHAGSCMRSRDARNRRFRFTKLIVTFYEDLLSHIDLQHLIDSGLHMVRFRNTRVNRQSRMDLIYALEKAQAWICEKYDVSSWPISIILDIQNTMVRTGVISKEIESGTVDFELGEIVNITCNPEFYDKVNKEVIYIDDPFTMEVLRPGIELTMCFGLTRYVVLEMLNKQTAKCKVIRGGPLSTEDIVVIRGVRYKRPILSDIDKETLSFAREFQIEMLAYYGVRYPSTIRNIRKYLGESYKPFVMSCISDEEGLSNIDEIIEVSDGIMLIRDLLFYQLTNIFKLPAIQMQLCAKCQKAGKPIFLSGNVLEETLTQGNSVSDCDISDVTNGILQGAGFVLKRYTCAQNIIEGVKFFNSICYSTENLEPEYHFWKLLEEDNRPVNAAVGCAIAAVILARQTLSRVIIVPTVTGRTGAKILSALAPPMIIVTLSRSTAVARKMQTYRGVVAIIYDKPPAKGGFNVDMPARIKFAVEYCIKNNYLSFGASYVVLQKASIYSSFCDTVQSFKVDLRKDVHHTNDNKCKRSKMFYKEPIAPLMNIYPNEVFYVSNEKEDDHLVAT